MGTLLERNEAIARRVDSLRPAADRIGEVLRRGKAEQLLAGVDAAGRGYAPASPATLRRRGPGQVLVPDGEASRLIRDYTVTAEVQPGRIRVSAGWPGLDWVRYHRTGTRRMPARDPGGFRESDLAECREILQRYVIDGR